MLGVSASNVECVARGFTSRLSADKKPPKPGDVKFAVQSYHLDSDREVEELNTAYIESLG